MSHSIMSTKSEMRSQIKTSKQFQYTDVVGTKCLLNPVLNSSYWTSWLTNYSVQMHSVTNPF